MTNQHAKSADRRVEEAAAGGDELTLDKETIQDLDPTEPDAAAVKGGLTNPTTTTVFGCTASCGC